MYRALFCPVPFLQEYVAMTVRFILRVALICILALGQAWVTGVLLLTGQMEILLLCSIIASVFWFWWSWSCFLHKRRAELVLSCVFLLLTMTLLALCVLEVMDMSDTLLQES